MTARYQFRCPLEVSEVAPYLWSNRERACTVDSILSTPRQLGRRWQSTVDTRVLFPHGMEDMELQRRAAIVNLLLRQPVRHRAIQRFPSELPSTRTSTLRLCLPVHERVQRWRYGGRCSNWQIRSPCKASMFIPNVLAQLLRMQVALDIGRCGSPFRSHSAIKDNMSVQPWLNDARDYPGPSSLLLVILGMDRVVQQCSAGLSHQNEISLLHLTPGD